MQARSAAIIGWACSTHELLPRECGRCKCGGLKGIRSRKLRVMSAKPPKAGTPNFEAVHSLSDQSLSIDPRPTEQDSVVKCPRGRPEEYKIAQNGQNLPAYLVAIPMRRHASAPRRAGISSPVAATPFFDSGRRCSRGFDRYPK